MKNITLNPGGVIGAIVFLAAAITVVVMTADPDGMGSYLGKLGIFALLIGAFGGNYVWERLFPNSK